MGYTRISTARKRCSPFASKTEEAARIIEDLQGRCGEIKVAECDSGIILDAEALSFGPCEE